MLQRCPFISKHALVRGITRDSKFKERYGPKEKCVTSRRGDGVRRRDMNRELRVFIAQQLVLGENGNLSTPDVL
jgi:hypothetical protein